MCIYLYVKTHQITGLKYLGKTNKKDPHHYPGSGKYWVNHLKKYGKNYTTEILKECSSNEEVKFWGMYYSNLWNVVNDIGWANLKPESGDGGCLVPWNKGLKGPECSIWTEEAKQKRKNTMSSKSPEELLKIRQKISQSLKGKPKSEETKIKMSKPKSEEWKIRSSLARKGKPMSEEQKELRRKPKSEEHKAKIRESVLRVLQEKKSK